MVCLHIITWTQGEWIPCVSQELIRFFIHTDNRTHWIIRELIDVEYVFHTGYKLSIFFGRDAPVVIHMGTESVFLKPFRSYLY